jgi:phage minor structural protein
MDFYIVDREFKLQTISSTSAESDFPVVTSNEEITLDTASRRMQLSLAFDKNTTSSIKEKVKVGYYVLYKDRNNKFIWMTILKVTHNPLTGLRTLECENASMDLLNESVEPSPANGAHNIVYYIEKFTLDSGWTIGVNEVANLSRTLEWDGESTALERIQSVATQFDNAELEFSFEFNGNQLVSRKINIYKKRGRDTEFKLYVNKDINSIETTSDIYQLVNAIRPYGGTPEGKDQPINLKGYNWTDPEGRFKINKEKGIVMDTHNVKMWSRTNSENNYFLQSKTWTTTNQKELLDTTINWLKQYSQPVETYTVDIDNLPHDLQVGDYISLVDENEELFLKSRVQKLTYDYTTDNVVAELSDFVRLESGLSQQLQDLANQFQNNINSSIPYNVEIISSQPFFVNGEGTITLTARITKGNLDVTNLFSTFNWTRLKLDGTLDESWSDTGLTITITAGSELRYTYIVDAKD